MACWVTAATTLGIVFTMMIWLVTDLNAFIPPPVWSLKSYPLAAVRVQHSSNESEPGGSLLLLLLESLSALSSDSFSFSWILSIASSLNSSADNLLLWMLLFLANLLGLEGNGLDGDRDFSQGCEGVLGFCWSCSMITRLFCMDLLWFMLIWLLISMMALVAWFALNWYVVLWKRVLMCVVGLVAFREFVLSDSR